MIQQIQASKFIPEDEKRFYVQNVMCGSWSNATETMKEVAEAEGMYRDQEPTYANTGAGVLGCAHYERSCKQKCPTCARFFTCHKCHDAEVKSHSMDRYTVQTLLCMVCNVEQPVGSHCVSPQCVGAPNFAKNDCLKCRVYTHRDVFHCDSCDVCRLGAAEDYVHCDKCSVCIAKSSFAVHRCVEGSHSANCPICHDSMSSAGSSRPVVVAMCGHALHEDCLNEYVGHGSFKCPVCMHVLGDMSLQFRQMSQIIAEQPMPPEYRGAKATVQCVCCQHVSVVPYHFVGHQCPECKSFNTSIVATDGLPDQQQLEAMVDDDDGEGYGSAEESSNPMSIDEDDDEYDWEDEEEGGSGEMSGAYFE